ncbi:hypothetical protein NLJ89_g1487 [Agrocybe chaxingu]|uniref:DUF6533 domain-containing protein n=1 Tax=Agrocybe chaxingu TaxID=84603 RepID=A0A9W8MZZ1_9AGAR|nr:hypothetical protein NLJ89_g1487 [Agrocybe chaxingu]
MMDAVNTTVREIEQFETFTRATMVDGALSMDIPSSSTNQISFEVAACALFVFDYLLTFGMEVQYVWLRPWTPMKVIYFLERYLPFIDTVWLEVQPLTHLAVAVRFTQSPSIKACTQLRSAAASLMFVGLATSELILALRVWAVWNQHAVITILLPILSFKFAVPPPPPLFGCVTAAASQIIFINWVLLLLWDTLVLLLMLIPAFHAYSLHGTSALYYIIYTEGILYYFCIFAMSTINIVLLHVQSIAIEYRFMFVLTTRSLHSLLASRVLLHIRAAADQDAHPDIEVESISVAIDAPAASRNGQTSETSPRTKEMEDVPLSIWEGGASIKKIMNVH